MTRGQFSAVANGPSVETSENAKRRDAARGLCAKSASATLAAAFAIATAQPALGFADETESESEPTVQPVQTIEAGSAIQTTQRKSPSGDPTPDGSAFQPQRRRNWWNRARELLFADIELSAEQTLAVDEIVEAQLNTRALLRRADAEVSAARKARDSERGDAAREEFRALKKQLKEVHEIHESMRAVLAEEQRPTFDMNRARHVAEMRKAEQIRSEKRAKKPEKKRVERRIH
jgi:hypothetical protein